jgi:hypothetical protein
MAHRRMGLILGIVLATCASGGGVVAAAAKKSSAAAAISAANAAALREQIDRSCLAAVLPLIDSSDGRLTDAARAAYVKWAEDLVLRELAKENQTIPTDCLAEVRADPVLRDAVFAAVYPPDPSILQNYSYLRAELGPAFMSRYRPLVLAAAVGKRAKGDEADAAVVDVTGIEPAPAPTGAKAEKAAAQVDQTAQYLKTSGVAALQVWQDPARQHALASYLQSHGVDAKLAAQAEEPKQLGGLLKRAMVQLGQRPEARSPKPTTSQWLRHLATVFESTPSSVPTIKGGHVLSWPLFPMDKAPWPLLVPLLRPVPLDEAQYIWETFEGQHGPDRYHTYGPYRNATAAMPYELQPSKWHWEAWPDRIAHGGECVSISIGTVDLYSSLCKPAVHAGQPGHANLIAFKRDNGDWYADIEQAFAGGPDVTFAQWYFNEDPGSGIRFRKLYNWAGSEYHLGLALGMNVGLSSYMDTRIIANIYKAMNADQKHALGAKLLTQGLAVNPYNPELWYRLAQLSPDARTGVALAKAAVAKQGPTEAEGVDAPRQVSLENFVEEEHSKPVNAAMTRYWRTVEQFVVRLGVLNNPVPADDAEGREIYAFLQGVPGMKAEDLAAYTARFGPPTVALPASKKKGAAKG